MHNTAATNFFVSRLLTYFLTWESQTVPSFRVWGKQGEKEENPLNYFNILACLTIRRWLHRRRCHVPPTSDFYHVQSSGSLARPLLSEAKPSYVYSILKSYGQSSRSLIRLLLQELKPSCVDSKITWSSELRIYNLKKTSPPQSRSQAVVCVSTPRMYPRSGYFLVKYKLILLVLHEHCSGKVIFIMFLSFIKSPLLKEVNLCHFIFRFA